MQHRFIEEVLKSQEISLSLMFLIFNLWEKFLNDAAGGVGGSFPLILQLQLF